MVDDLIREITEPEADRPEASKSTARRRLLAAAQADAGRLPQKRIRLGRRGLAAIIALLAVPTGVALATELSGDGGQTVVSLTDCPELLTALEERGLGTEGLVLADCPVGAEVDQTLALIANLEERRSEMETGGEPAKLHRVVGFGRSTDGTPWGLAGFAGEAESEPGQ